MSGECDDPNCETCRWLYGPRVNTQKVAGSGAGANTLSDCDLPEVQAYVVGVQWDPESDDRPDLVDAVNMADAALAALWADREELERARVILREMVEEQEKRIEALEAERDELREQLRLCNIDQLQAEADLFNLRSEWSHGKVELAKAEAERDELKEWYAKHTDWAEAERDRATKAEEERDDWRT